MLHFVMFTDVCQQTDSSQSADGVFVLCSLEPCFRNDTSRDTTPAPSHVTAVAAAAAAAGQAASSTTCTWSSIQKWLLWSLYRAEVDNQLFSRLRKGRLLSVI